MVFRCMRIVSIISLLLIGLLGHSQSLKISALSCEHTINPLGITTQKPVLSWKMWSAGKNKSQTAYEVIVDNDKKAIDNQQGHYWRSGKTISNQNANIVYAGRPLQSFTRYYWRVRVYDEKGMPSGWSEPAWFETAILAPAHWKASWITDGKPLPVKEEDFYREDRMPVFRKVLNISRPVRSARLYIAAAGYYEASLNGQKIGDDVLTPGWTNFDKRVLYKTYDVTCVISKGENIADILLGNGWYNPLPLRFWGRYNLRDVLPTGRPAVKAQLRIDYMDGSVETVVTDGSWQFTESAVVKNNVYLGETFDARADAGGWLTSVADNTGKNAVVVNGPAGRLEADLQPPVRVKRIVKPVAINEVAKGVFVADMGENFAGVAKIAVNAPRGTKISLRYGEDIYENGTLNGMTAVAGQIKRSNGGPGAPAVAWQEDHYIAAGKGTETWHPRFTFHVFRYVEIKGWPGTPSKDDISGLVMHADLPAAGAFECSNPLFNKIQENVLRTFKSNIFSVQSDCAGREKFGYGGDLFCTIESFAYNMDMHNFYRKVLQDFEDDQRPLGGIPETAPFVGLYDKGPGDKSGPLGWQLGYPYLVEKLYEFYGDKAVVKKYYPSLQKQLKFLMNNAKGDLYDEDISDHESLEEKPEALTASLFYYHHILLMERFAKLLDKPAEAQRYEGLALTVKKAILKRFYKGNGRFDNETQAAQVFPLWYQMLSGTDKSKTVDGMKTAFEKKGNHNHSGIFTTKMMLDVLRAEGENELAYTIANQKEFPGWGHMIEKGATTIWETWQYSDDVFSQNHPMFGSVTEWFYRSLLGINSTSPGFQTFMIKPFPASDLQFARGYYDVPGGRIVCDWKKERGAFNLSVEIPVNTVAEIHVPFNGNRRLVMAGKSARFLREDKGHLVYRVGSGAYQFKSAIKQ